MSKGLQMLEILKHDEDIRDNGAYVPVLRSIEQELKEREYLYHFLGDLFDECEIEISADYDEDLRKYIVEFKIDGKYKLHIYCDRKEYLFWREKSGVDDQYTPEDLK